MRMVPTEFIKTIYLGDRACKSISIESWNKRVLIQVDEVSRIRDQSGQWNFYNDENIVDGLLVFSDVRSVSFDPTGPIPNDYIGDFEAEQLPDCFYRFRLSAGAVDESGHTVQVLMTIEAKNLHLEDPVNPGKAIDN